MLALTSNKTLFITSLFFLSFCFSTLSYGDTSHQNNALNTSLSETPKRVAALSWELVESVIELGVTPIAISDIKGYREWVRVPSIPAETQDIGDRAEPNLEKLAQLKPDVILINLAQKDIRSKLERIAPVVFFDNYSADHNNAEQADKAFLALAALLDKEEQAKTKLAQREVKFEELQKKLDRAFPDGLPDVVTMRFANTTSAYVYGGNSMPQYALEKLGIKNPITIKNSQWGLEQKRLKFLRSVDQGVVMYFQPFHQEDQLAKSPLWQAMPFVKQNKVASIESTWTYGGAMSLQYLAESMTDALLKIANE
jgi:iron complex transport system substrate-binding protein